MPYKRNAISGLMQYGILTVLTLALLLLFPRIKGDEAFGIYATLTIIGNLTIFTNLGLNHALIRFLASQGNTEESQADVVANIFLLTVVGIVVSVSCLFIENWFIGYNRISPSIYTTDVSFFYKCLAVSNFLLLLGQTFSSMLDAAHKIYLSNRAQIFYAIGYNGGIIAILLSNGNFQQMGIVAVATAFIWFIYMAFMAIQVWGVPQFSLLFSSGKKSIRKQVKYGSKIFASSAVNFFYEPLSKMLIARYFGLAFVGIFELAMKVRGQLWGIVYKLIYPSFPLFAETDDKAKHVAMVKNAQMLVMFCMIPVLAGLWISMSLVLPWVTNEHIELKYISICSMSSAYLLFSAVLIPTNFYLNAKGRPEVMVYAQIANVVVNFLVIYLLHDRLGYLSAVLANVLSIMGSYLIVLFFQDSILSLKGVLSLKNAISWVLIVLATFSPLFLQLQFEEGAILAFIMIGLSASIWGLGCYWFVPDLISLLPIKNKKPIVG